MSDEEQNDSKGTRKVFVSYSQSNPEIVSTVRSLVDRLFENGVEAISDIYNLEPGQNLHLFMESSVVDPTIDRVLIVCDKTYEEKANSRRGGVGEEASLITPELYRSTDQRKFIPIIIEHHDDGRACCPAFVKSNTLHRSY